MAGNTINKSYFREKRVTYSINLILPPQTRNITHLHKHPFQVGNYNSCQDWLPRETEKAVLSRGMVFHVMIYKSLVIAPVAEQGNYAISVPWSRIIPFAGVPAASPRQQWQSSQSQPRWCQQSERHTSPMNKVLSPSCHPACWMCTSESLFMVALDTSSPPHFCSILLREMRFIC